VIFLTSSMEITSIITPDYTPPYKLEFGFEVKLNSSPTPQQSANEL